MDAAIVKVGGSLALYPEKLRFLCNELSELSKQHKFIVVPGGGEFSDVARNFDKRFSLQPKTSHRVAILGMDQYGFVLSDLIANSCLVHHLEDLPYVGFGKPLIFLPSNFLFDDSSLEESWDVTSDSIAVYIGQKIGVTTVILVTDVDGVFTRDPKKYSDAKLLKKISSNELLQLHQRTSVDRFLPKILSQSKMQCYVINGFHPERLEAVLNGKTTIYTKIIASSSN